MTTIHRLGSLGASRSLQLLCVGAAISIGASWHGPAVYAEVLAAGNVTAALPGAGGTFESTLVVGDSMIGTLAINGGSALRLTHAASLSVADEFNSIGAVTMSGMGSYLEADGTMLIGNRGAATFEVRSQASFQAKNGLQLGVSATGDGTLIVENLGSILGIQSPTIIGAAGIGTMQLLGGGRTVASSLTVGRSAGSRGLLTIEGISSQWQQAGELIVGETGDGVIEISQQGQLLTGMSTLGVNGSSSGRLNVSGIGSRWNVSGPFALLTIGAGGYGELSITAGGRTAVAGPGYIGMVSGSRGAVVVEGAGSQLSLAGLTLGNAGEGVLRVRQGGRVTTTAGLTIGIASNGRGEAIVDGAESVLEATSQTKMTIGSGPAGRGLLTVSNGGLVRAITGMSVGKFGEIAVDGGRVMLGESKLDNQGLIRGAGRIDGAISNAASGRIRAESGGTLIVDKTLTNDGQIEVDGSELVTMGALANQGVITLREAVLRGGADGMANNSPGRIAVIGGVVDVYGELNNKSGAQIVVGGGATSVFYDTVNNAGQLSVFAGADVLMLKDFSCSPSSLLGMQLGAADLTDALGQVEVSGQATLAGTLSVELAGGVAPTLGSSFSLLTAMNGLSGTFSAANLPALEGGLAWDLHYSDNSVLLSVVADGGPSADFDADGDVDAADLAQWKLGFGKLDALFSDGDANRDGVVNGSDFVVWQRQLGTPPSAPPSAPASAAVAGAVPEPRGVALLASALVAMVGCRRRA